MIEEMERMFRNLRSGKDKLTAAEHTALSNALRSSGAGLALPHTLIEPAGMVLRDMKASPESASEVFPNINVKHLEAAISKMRSAAHRATK